jgi:hypothetical protein
VGVSAGNVGGSMVGAMNGTAVWFTAGAQALNAANSINTRQPSGKRQIPALPARVSTDRLLFSGVITFFS